MGVRTLFDYHFNTLSIAAVIRPDRMAEIRSTRKALSLAAAFRLRLFLCPIGAPSFPQPVTILYHSLGEMSISGSARFVELTNNQYLSNSTKAED